MRGLELDEQRRDFDAAVLWCVRPESAHRLLELAPAADLLAAPGLVPRHCHVHQPLQEVALGGLGGPPRVLELLVRGEVLALPDRIDTALESFHSLKLTRYAQLVATILLCGVDLFFRGKLEALLPGHRFVTTDSIDPPDVVIADMARIDCNEVADAWPDIPIMGYTNHNDAAGLRAGHAAGFDQVLVKSALDERAPQLVDELLEGRTE